MAGAGAAIGVAMWLTAQGPEGRNVAFPAGAALVDLKPVYSGILVAAGALIALCGLTAAATRRRALALAGACIALGAGISLDWVEVVMESAVKNQVSTPWELAGAGPRLAGYASLIALAAALLQTASLTPQSPPDGEKPRSET